MENKTRCMLTDFVDELLEYICCFPTLEYQDVVNLSSTCRRFNDVTQSDTIWCGKWTDRWPSLKLNETKNERCRNMFKEAITLERHLISQLATISSAVFDYVEVPRRFLRQFDEFHNGDEETLNLVSGLLHILASGKTHDNKYDLNQRYYATKVYHYVYHQKLKREWQQVIESLDDDINELERGAVLIAQWCNPMRKICANEISKQIDAIASRVKEKLDDETEDIRVVETINQVLYGEYKFTDNTEEYYDINNSFIDQVLLTKKGIPITLSVLYIAVASRLGLHLQGVNFPGHFLVRLSTLKDGKQESVYIDAFHGGEMMSEERCISQLLSHIQFTPLNNWTNEMLFQDANKRKLFIRMVGNIINIQKEKVVMNSRNLSSLRAAHELMAILAPHDTNNHLILTKIDEHLRLDVEMESLHAPVPKLRSCVEHGCVKFKVGHLMRHQRYHYMCVVYGWDSVCRMDETWQAQMNVHRLDNKDEQPFYHVLAHDGSSRYAAQENLQPVEMLSGDIPLFGPISHPEVGKYFTGFDVLHCCYVPCDRLREMYPED